MLRHLIHRDFPNKFYFLVSLLNTQAISDDIKKLLDDLKEKFESTDFEVSDFNKTVEKISEKTKKHYNLRQLSTSTGGKMYKDLLTNLQELKDNGLPELPKTKEEEEEERKKEVMKKEEERKKKDPNQSTYDPILLLLGCATIWGISKVATNINLSVADGFYLLTEMNQNSQCQIQDLTEKMGNKIDEFQNKIKTIPDGIDNRLIQLEGKTDKMQKQIGGMQKQIGGMEEKIGGMEEKIGGMQKQIGGMEEKIGGMEEKIGGMQKQINGMQKQIGGMEEKIGGIEEKIGGMQKQIDSIGRYIKENSALIREMIAQSEATKQIKNIVIQIAREHNSIKRAVQGPLINYSGFDGNTLPIANEV